MTLYTETTNKRNEQQETTTYTNKNKIDKFKEYNAN